MVFRDFICEKCKSKIEISFNSINDTNPTDLKCKEKKCDGIMKYDWSQLNQSMTIIPPHMRAGGETFNYEKIPRHKKKYK